jgi:hypothetical protein
LEVRSTPRLRPVRQKAEALPQPPGAPRKELPEGSQWLGEALLKPQANEVAPEILTSSGASALETDHEARTARFAGSTMKLFTGLILAAAALACPARAQEPLTLTVHPSGFDHPSGEAQARDEQLQRRTEKADFLLRNICVQCGGRTDGRGSRAPFNPLEALNARR